MTTDITAWLSIGSTYTYLTAMRMGSVQIQQDLKFHIKPISIREIMKSMDNIPFPPSKKAKADYMWRDIQRRAKFYSIPEPSSQVPYPLQNFDKANLVGIVMNKRGKYLEYLKETYRLWFLKGIEAGSEENLRSVFSTLNIELDDVLQEASSDKTFSAYEKETELARVKGIFGAPSFTVKDEIFWGDDRLEDAIRYAKGISPDSSACPTD